MMSRVKLLMIRVGSIQSFSTKSKSRERFPLPKGTQRTMSVDEKLALRSLPGIKIMEEYDKVFPPGKPTLPMEDDRMHYTDKE